MLRDLTLVPQIRHFITPASAGLKMYYAATPEYYCTPGLTIPSWTGSLRKYGPFERPPAGAHQVFTLHRAPVEDLISRWRTGDIAAIVWDVGVPGAALTFEQAAACVARWTPAQRETFAAFRAELDAEFEIGIELEISLRLQLRTENALFSALTFAAVAALNLEVSLFMSESVFPEALCPASPKLSRFPSQTTGRLSRRRSHAARSSRGRHSVSSSPASRGRSARCSVRLPSFHTSSSGCLLLSS